MPQGHKPPKKITDMVLTARVRVGDNPSQTRYTVNYQITTVDEDGSVVKGPWSRTSGDGDLSPADQNQIRGIVNRLYATARTALGTDPMP